MANMLIVDDSRTSRRILTNILIEHGDTVIGEATNGEEGVAKFKELQPDIVTLDITMPVMDGIHALKAIREFDNEANVIMVTAAGQQEKMVEALKLGAAEFVTKPFEAAEVIRAIEGVKL